MSASEQPIVHTPGPWRVEYRHDGIAFGVSAPEIMRDDCDVLCSMPVAYKDACSINENARLIAAAPELLAALQAVLRWNENPTLEPGLPQELEQMVFESLRKVV